MMLSGIAASAEEINRIVLRHCRSGSGRGTRSYRSQCYDRRDRHCDPAERGDHGTDEGCDKRVKSRQQGCKDGNRFARFEFGPGGGRQPQTAAFSHSRDRTRERGLPTADEGHDDRRIRGDGACCNRGHPKHFSSASHYGLARIGSETAIHWR